MSRPGFVSVAQVDSTQDIGNWIGVKIKKNIFKKPPPSG